MANLRILVPEATTNYITNPSMRYDTTGWESAGIGTLYVERSFDTARFGMTSLFVGMEENYAQMGVFFRVNSLSGIQGSVTASVYVRGAPQVRNPVVGTIPRTPKLRLRLIDNPTGKEWVSKTITPSAEKWTRLSATGILTGSNDVRMYVEATESPGAAIFGFYLDGAQLEKKAYPTTYCDGDQPGCRWNLTAHGSISTRDGFTRAGGRWVDLAGPCRGNDDLYFTVLGGFGMPPITNNIQSWANAPGSYYQNLKVMDRVVTLSFHAKKKDLRLIGQPKLNRLHELRQQLIDLIKPDKTQGGEAFLFEYDDGERPLYMRFRYEAGLEGEWDVRNPWVNSFPIRLLAVDPLWVEDNQNVYNLDFSETIPLSGTETNAFKRVEGVWDRIKSPAGTTPNAPVYAIALGPKGEVYLAGDFTNIGNRIVKWDGTTFTELGVGGANGAVNGIAVAPDETVYATGAFTAIGGVACTRAAKWNPVTNAWSALSTGLNDVGRAVCVAPNDQVYFGGDFTQAGGVTMNRICRWDGLQFRTVGEVSGVNASVRAIVNAGDGATLYMGGDFTAPASGAGAYVRLASIDMTTNLITGLAGANNSIYALAVGKDGTLYFGGSFTKEGTGISDRKRIAYYGGGITHQLGDGFITGTVYALSFAPDGTLYIGGDFALSGTTPTARLAKWTKNVILPVDLIPSKTGSSLAYSILSHPSGDLYVGLDNVTTASFASGITTVTNSGTTEVQPVIYIQGPGILRYLENLATHKRVYFNLTLQPSEEVFIDFPKSTIYSTVRGNLYGYVLNGSDFKAFNLIPGDNRIAAFMTDDVNGVMKISYIPQHWSADAVVDAEEL